MREKLNARLTFHGIGQGLFYSGNIYPDSSNRDYFTFVYDCGTYYKKDYDTLNREIEHVKYCNSNAEERVIDALFVSHFDMDHISGIPQLLKKYKVKNVFIPYFAPEVMWLLMAANELSLDDELARLYIDPVQFFIERGCQNIFVIYPSRHDQPTGGDHVEQRENENHFFRFSGEIFGTDTVDVNNQTAYVYQCGSLSVFPFSVRWQFHIYQDQTEDEQNHIRNKIKQRINPKLLDLKGGINTDNDLWSLLLDKELFAYAKELYKTVKYGINQSSLVLYHAPVSEEGNLSGVYWPYYECFPYCPVLGNMATGTLLTGDIDLNNLRDNGYEFAQFITKQSEDIGVFQLPHHGSGKSISINQISRVLKKGRAILVCSYGRGNQFKHPDPYILDKLTLNYRSDVVHVTSDESYSYTIIEYDYH